MGSHFTKWTPPMRPPLENCKVSDFLQLNTRLTPTHETSVEVWWDDRRLFVHALCESSHIPAVQKPRDSPLFHGECFEIFIAELGKAHYFEFQGDAAGSVYDSKVPSFEENDRWREWSKWDCGGVTYTADILQDYGWEGFWTIPWRSLDMSAHSEKRMKFCRIAELGPSGQLEYSSWPFSESCFDEPHSWGSLSTNQKP